MERRRLRWFKAPLKAIHYCQHLGRRDHWVSWKNHAVHNAVRRTEVGQASGVFNIRITDFTAVKKLTARQKYDHRDLDRGEAQLIRTGHALWRDRRKLGDTVAEREGINAALESVWNAKKGYRVELAKKRALRFSQYLVDYKRTRDTCEAPSESSRKENIVAQTKTLCDELFDSLERRGLLEKNGEFRMARNGKVQPVWAITQLGKWLVESGQLENYLATWKTDLKSS